VLFRDSYGRPPVYYGVYSSPELAEARMRVLEQEEIADFGYSHDYVIRTVRLDSGE
jgi:hypothetical protein